MSDGTGSGGSGGSGGGGDTGVVLGGAGADGCETRRVTLRTRPATA